MRSTVATALILLTAIVAQAAGFTIVHDGHPRASIHLREDATDVERLAAREFVHYVEEMSGAELSIGDGAGRPIIFVVRGVDGEGYSLDVTPRRMRLTAPSPVALLHGVYDILRTDLGCRWYVGGEIGEVIPSAAEVVIPFGTRTVRPDWTMRAFVLADESRCWWALRNGLNAWYPADFVESLGSGVGGELLTDAEAGSPASWYAPDGVTAGDIARHAGARWVFLSPHASSGWEQFGEWERSRDTGVCVLIDPVTATSLPQASPRTLTARMADLHARGARACTARSTGWQWARTGPVIWMMARLMWDAEASVERLLDDWYRGFYGRAAAPMRDFAGVAQKMNLPEDEWLDIDAVNAAEAYLSAALEAAESATVRERVAVRRAAFRHAVDRLRIADQFNCTSAWAEYRHSGDTDALHRAIAAAERLAKRPGDVGRRFEDKLAMMKAFAARHLADMPKQWRFRLDEKDVGVDEGWFAPGYDDADWKSIQIGSPWEDQGYTDYDGHAWYRLRMHFAEDWPRRLSLKFLGVDGEGWVYVNGELIGHHVGWDEPFALSIPPGLVKRGRTNLIAVRVWDGGGAGGIYAPVSIGGMSEDL